MGIQGLLRSLKSVVTVKHLKEYKGLTIAIDTYAWLHRIIKGKCSNELFTFQLSNKFINEVLTRIDRFRDYDINVIMVFDGAPLPGKVEEEKIRKARREQCEQEAMQYLNQGNSALGNKKLIESVDITPEIAYKLIETLRKKNIQYIVAPYEADAELAYLSRTGIADVILTQDSDLLAYGAKRVFYKYDPKTNLGEEILLENIRKNEDPTLRFFTHCMFLSACIMSGCDYISTIPGIGHKTAFRLVTSNGNGGRAIQEAKRIKVVPPLYEQNFIKAFLIFRFQYVYCPIQKDCVMVNDLEKEVNKIRSQQNPKDKQNAEWIEQCLDDYILNNLKTNKFDFREFIGDKPEQETARGIGQGRIHPVTKKPYITNSNITTQVFNLRRSKNQIKKAYSQPNNLQNYLKPTKDRLRIETQGIQIKTRTQFFVRNNLKKQASTNIELEPMSEENYKANFSASEDSDRLLVEKQVTKKEFESRIERLFNSVFNEDWFDYFRERCQEEMECEA